jgi:photosystem II PsbU protein
MALVASLASSLVLAGAQADDIADSSALQGFLSNYVPAATQRMPTSLNAYVPPGLSEAEYKALKKAEDAKKAQNKQRFPKGKKTLDIADWLKTMEQKQTFKGDQFSGSGHTYVKQKFSSKDEFDKVNKKTGGTASFKNPFSKFVLPAVSNVKHGNGPDALSSHHNSPTEYSPATDEQQAVQKLLANASNRPMTLSAIGVALFSLATMLGARLWRASSGSLGSDMSVAMAPASGDNNMELKAQSETTPMPAENVNGAGWGSARREFMSTVAGAAGAAVATPALADVDYAGLPYLGGSAKIDINNANVRVYVKLPGMYPGAAGKICSNGPYKSVSDLYNIKGISEAEKSAIKKYEDRLIVLEPSAMYVIDRLNNGLYR